MTKVTVIIPTYNMEKYIARTMYSVLNQTYKNYEIIVVSDNSTDSTNTIVEDFIKKYDNISLIVNEKNEGVSASRNKGILEAKGEYVAFLDADDLWKTKKLETHVKFLQDNPEVGMSFDCSVFIDDKDRRLGLYQIPKKFKEITPNYILCRNPCSNGSAVVARTELMKNNLFDENLINSEDVECWLRFCLSGGRIEGINQLLTCYRVRENSASSNVGNQMNSLESLFNKTKTYAPELVRDYGELCKAYNLRFMARRSFKDGNNFIALQYFKMAVNTDKRIFLEEPKKTSVTLIAIVLSLLLPRLIQNVLLSSLSLFSKSDETEIELEAK